jgi:hypothetical protein
VFTALLLACIQSAQPAPAPGPQVRVVRRAPPPPDAVIGDHAELTLTMIGGLPVIAIEIGGKQFHFGFDTGAPGGARLDAATAELLAMEPVGRGMAADPSGRDPQPVRVYKLAEVKVGGVTVQGLSATAPETARMHREGIDGVLGPSPFAGYVVTIDYAHGRFRLERGALPEPDGRSVFGYDPPFPTVPLTIEGRTIPAHVDTGNARFAIIVPADFAEGLKNRGAAHSIGVGRTVSSTIEMSATRIDGKAMLGGVPLEAAEIGWPSVVPIANVGSLGLGGTLVEVDPGNRRIRISRPR